MYPCLHGSSPSKILMYNDCDTNNRVPRWTFMDSGESEVRPGALYELIKRSCLCLYKTQTHAKDCWANTADSFIPSFSFPEIVLQEVPLTNIKWHSDPWSVTVTSLPIFPTISWPWLPSPNYEGFLWSACNGYGMPAGNAYPSGHLVPSRFLVQVYAPFVEIVFQNLQCLFSTFHLGYPSVLSRFCFAKQWIC